MLGPEINSSSFLKNVLPPISLVALWSSGCLYEFHKVKIDTEDSLLNFFLILKVYIFTFAM